MLGINFEYDGYKLNGKRVSAKQVFDIYIYLVMILLFFGELKDTHAIRTNKRESDALVLLNRPL